MDGTGLNLRKAREDAGSAEVLANIEQDMADAKILNVTRTPGFFVNGKPLKDFGDEQLKALVSRELKGNIAMRWYQHSTHGSSFMTSLKNRLPRVEANATKKAISKSDRYQFSAGANSPQARAADLPPPRSQSLQCQHGLRRAGRDAPAAAGPQDQLLAPDADNHQSAARASEQNLRRHLPWAHAGSRRRGRPL